MNAGDKLIAIVPIQLSEKEEWPEGTEVEIVQKRPCSPQLLHCGESSYELRAANGATGSFAEIDLQGENRWFRSATE